jgi:hypothetical protein
MRPCHMARWEGTYDKGRVVSANVRHAALLHAVTALTQLSSAGAAGRFAQLHHV